MFAHAGIVAAVGGRIQPVISMFYPVCFLRASCWMIGKPSDVLLYNDID